MIQIYNNATTITVGDGFTAMDCVKAEFKTNYGATYMYGGARLSKNWVKGDIIFGYLIQDKLNKYIRTSRNSNCPKSGEVKIDIPANNESIVKILSETVSNGGTVASNSCLEAYFKNEYVVKDLYIQSENKTISGNWLKRDLIKGVLSNNVFTTTTKGTCPTGEISETTVTVKANNLSITPYGAVTTSEVRIPQPLRITGDAAGTTTVTMNKKGAYLIAGVFVLIGLMLLSK